MNSKLIIADWNIKGKGEVFRQLAEYMSLPYENKIYLDRKDWFEKDKKTLNTNFPNLPYILDGDRVITESEACALYLIYKAKRFELLGNNDEEILHINQVRGVLDDLLTNMIRVAFNKEGDVETGLDELIVPKLSAIAKHLGNHEWLVGKLTFLDFLLVRLVSVLSLQGDFMAKFPNLVEHLKRFRELPGIKEYLASERNLKVPHVLPEMTNINFKVMD